MLIRRRFRIWISKEFLPVNEVRRAYYHKWEERILFNYLFSFRTARNPGIRRKASSTLGKKKDTCNLLLGQLGFPGLLLFLKMQYLPLGQTWLKYELPGSLVFVQSPYFTPTKAPTPIDSRLVDAIKTWFWSVTLPGRHLNPVPCGHTSVPSLLAVNNEKYPDGQDNWSSMGLSADIEATSVTRDRWVS